MRAFNLKRRLISGNKKNIINSFVKANSKSYHGYFFSVQPNTSDILKSGENVLIYEAPEYKEILDNLNKKNYFEIVPRGSDNINKLYDIWEEAMMSTSFKAKYFSLIPFFMEDRNSAKATKKFVMNMELFPETKHLRFTIAMLSGLHTIYEPLEDVVPIPPEDFRIRHLVSRSRPPHFVDMDMLYANRKLPNIYCFDSQGTWVKEGVNHPLLKLDKSYNEKNWFNHLLWENQWL